MSNILEVCVDNLLTTLTLGETTSNLKKVKQDLQIKLQLLDGLITILLLPQDA